MSEEDWQAAWDPVVARVGTDLGLWAWRGADVIDPSMVRRLCEPLELDCPLHHDPAVAAEHGHDRLPAPYTAAMPFSLPPYWSPGDPPLFADAARDAQPSRSAIAGLDIPGAPPTTGFFVAEAEVEFARMAHVGERLEQTSLRLLSCAPKQTAVGRGAFMTLEAELRSVEEGDVVCVHRLTTFSYTPA